MSRIVWKPEEKNSLVENIVQQLRNDRFKKFLSALRSAQESLLAEDRRRNVTTITPFQDIEQLVKEKLSASPSTPTLPLPTTENPAVSSDQPASIQLLNKEDVAQMVEELFFKLVDPIVDTLMTEVSNRLAATSREVLSASISSFLANYKNGNGNGNGKAAVAVKKINAAVVGLKGDQPTYVDKDFKDRFNIDYYDSQDGASERLQSMVESKDVVFVNTKFVSHSKIDCAKFASGKLVKYHGGMSQLKGLLEEYWRKMNPNA
jgi:hypothetical protein